MTRDAQPWHELQDSDTGTWLVFTCTHTWVIDLDVRIVRQKMTGVEPEHTPGRAWILLRLDQCMVGEDLRWTLSRSPDPIAAPDAPSAGMVLAIVPGL